MQVNATDSKLLCTLKFIDESAALSLAEPSLGFELFYVNIFFVLKTSEN